MSDENNDMQDRIRQALQRRKKEREQPKQQPVVSKPPQREERPPSQGQSRSEARPPQRAEQSPSQSRPRPEQRQQTHSRSDSAGGRPEARPPNPERPETRSEVEVGASPDRQQLGATGLARASGGRFLNPYNFVRYLGQNRPKDHVLGDAPPPPHDRYLGLTGRITCELEAVTPLFISDSHRIEVDPQQPDHKLYRFFQYGGQDAIPATGLRGSIRSVFEAVTNSCFAVFDGRRFDLREGKLPYGLVPARVVEIDAQEAKLELLDCSRGVPSNVRLYKRKEKLVEVMNAAAVSAYEEQVLDTKTKIVFDPSLSLLPKGMKDGDRVAALIDLLPVNNKIYQYFRLKEIVPAQDHRSLHVSSGVRKVFGYVHITGPNIEKKHHERVFFRWDDAYPDAPEWSSIPAAARLTVSIDTVAEYNQHMSQYWDRNQRQVKRLEKEKKKPWPIYDGLCTADDLPCPGYFVQKDCKLRKGDLVYYIPTSKIGIPVLRSVLISRLPYRYDRASLLPDYLHHCNHYDALCPGCRVFGWVHEDPEKEASYTAYAGRVRFSHGKLTYNAGMLDNPEEGITLAILSSPKPTTSQFYLLGSEGNPSGSVDYNTSGVRLRGRKVYRHHKQADPIEYRRATDSRHPGKDDQNRTVCGVRKAGNVFRFTIDFHNLAPLELGALLWSLELEGEGCYHRMGFAKPLGFGSVAIRVKGLDVMLPAERYGCIQQKEDKPWRISLEGGWRDALAHKAEWVRHFKQAITELYGPDKPFVELDNVKDLLALLRQPPDLPIHYPRPPRRDRDGRLIDAPDPEGKNFEWFVGNKSRNGPKLALALACKDTTGLPLIDKKGNETTG